MLDEQEPVIKGNIASPKSVAHIMAQIHGMLLPLHRQEQAWKREGVSLSCQTKANWVIRAAEDWLLPIFVLLRKLLLACVILHADETGCQALRERSKKANTNSCMWLYSNLYNSEIYLMAYQNMECQQKWIRVRQSSTA